MCVECLNCGGIDQCYHTDKMPTRSEIEKLQMKQRSFPDSMNCNHDMDSGFFGIALAVYLFIILYAIFASVFRG